MYGPAWVVVAHPQRAAVAAAREGVDAWLPVRFEGAEGRVWRTRLLRVPVAEPGNPPAAAAGTPRRDTCPPDREAAPPSGGQGQAGPGDAR
eukprot:10208339-Alexandrium_andersonii.AAC.1